MRHENNDCIRYLMKEMDPSEEILMERAMMEDENLLIEVESMRQTLAKLDNLPRKTPSPELTGRIIKQAADHAKQKQNSRKSVNPVYKYAVAATVILTITAGGTLLFTDGADSGEDQVDSPVPSQQARETSGEADLAMDINKEDSKKEGEDRIFRAATTGKVDPWVDRENILHFEDYMINSNDDFNALLEQSTQKLKLIENSVINSRPVKSIQLTGTGN